MLKEICEQAHTVQSTLRGRLIPAEGSARLDGLNLPAARCARIRRIVIVACGTSWHAGLVGRHVLEELAGVPVSVEYASEYRYRTQLRVPGTLTVVIRSEEHTSELQSHSDLVCRLLLEKKKKKKKSKHRYKS